MDPVASSGAVNTSVSSDNSSNPNGGGQVLFFRNVSLGLSESKLRFRLIHSWEARNPYTKVLIGQEMLLIDEEVCRSPLASSLISFSCCRSPSASSLISFSCVFVLLFVGRFDCVVRDD